MSILGKLKPKFWDYQHVEGGPAKRLVNFPRIWKLSVLLTAVVSLGPLISITMVDYKVTQRSIESEFLLVTARIVSNTRRSVSFFLEERRSSLEFIAYDNDFEKLKDPIRLSSILKNLRKGFGKFTDLGVIDSAGIQRNYIGPYELKDKDYSDQSWYKQVVEHGVYISDVFLGYRKVPHLVIAVKRNLPEGLFFVLRASLDIEPFESLLSNVELSGSGDAFIINHDGTLQTSSRYCGKVLEKASVPVPEFSSKTEVFEAKNLRGEDIVIGYRYIEGTPFILMIVKIKRELMKPWQKTRLELIGFLTVSIILILAVILSTATYLVNRIYLADEKRLMIIHEMEYANKMASIGRLAAGVAHEINNPLAIINEKAGLIKDLLTLKSEEAKEQKLIRLADAVIVSVARCGRITKRLLRFARHMNVSLQPINLEELINEVLDFLHKEAEYRSIVVSVKATDDIPQFESDRGKLQQIFLNIINNAFAAMNDGGHLDIMIRRKNRGSVTITIADDGCGIPETDLQHVFEPFFSTKKGKGGTGLGLSITYSLVQEIGGNIGVQSEVGKGTTFIITLPLVTEKKERESNADITCG
jgi:two-component system NtrC family sensor kinase